MSRFNPNEYLNNYYTEVGNTETSFYVNQLNLPSAPQEGSIFGASFRQDNIIVSALAGLSRMAPISQQINDPDFNYLDHVPAGYENYTDRFVNSKNTDDINHTRFKIDSENRDKALLAENPVKSFFTGFIANALDPTILFPGTVYYKGAKNASAAAKAAINTGLAAAGSTLVQEAALQQTQEARSLGESSINILATAMMGASIGAASSKVQGKWFQSKGAKEAIRDTESVLKDDFIGPTKPPETGSLPMVPSGPKGPKGGAGSVGAATKINEAFELDADGNIQVSARKLEGVSLQMAEKAAKAFGTTVGNITPFFRLMSSPFYWDKKIALDLFENNVVINRNSESYYYEGKPMAVQTAIGLDLGNVDFKMTEYETDYMAQRGISSGIFKRERASKAKVGLSADEYDDAVWRTMITGVASDNSMVNKWAKKLKDEIFDPWKDRMIELNELPPDVSVQTAASYFMRVYNIDKILDPRYRPDFEQKVFNYIERVNNDLEFYQGKIGVLEGEIKKAEKAVKKAQKVQNKISKLEREMEKAKREETKARKKAEIDAIRNSKDYLDIEAAYEKLKFAQDRLKKSLPPEFFNSKGKIRRLLKTPEEKVAAMNEIIDNIVGLSDNRFDNPILAKLGIGIDPKTKPLKNRHFLIPDIEIEDYLIRSPRTIVPRYVRAMSTHYHLTKYAQNMGYNEKGEVLGGLLKERQEEFKARLRETSDPKKAAQLRKDFENGEKDINAMVEILQGIYGPTSNLMGDKFRNFTRNALTYNYIRQMGYMVIASLSDPAFIAVKHGIYRTLHHGLVPILQNLESANYNKQFLKSMGRCLETYGAYRLKSLASTDGLPQASGIFGKTLDWMGQTFGNITGMSQVNDFFQWVAGNTSIGRTLEAIDKYITTGKLEKSEMERLSELGLTKGYLKAIHNEFKKIGGVDESGAYWINWDEWDTSTNSGLMALNRFKGAVLKEIDSTIIKPGPQDKPLIANTDLGKLLLQYKSFPFAVMSKVLIPSLQRQDREFVEGMMFGLMTGAMTYVITSKLKGKEVDYSFDNLAFEAIDRFGILGILMEVPLTLQKMGLLPGVGTSRYQSRDWVGALGGPTLGMLSDFTNAMNIIKDSVIEGEPIKKKEASQIGKLWPYQNVWYIEGLNKQLGISDQLYESLGFEE